MDENRGHAWEYEFRRPKRLFRYTSFRMATRYKPLNNGISTCFVYNLSCGAEIFLLHELYVAIDIHDSMGKWIITYGFKMGSDSSLGNCVNWGRRY
jgi:hypothetical protein